MDYGINNDEVYLKIVAEGTSGVRNGVWISIQCGDGRPVIMGHSTST